MSKNDFMDEYKDFDEISEYSQEQEKELLYFATGFFGDLKCLIRQYIEHFFQDKTFYCGGKIPKNILITDRNISIVANYDIIKGVQRAYSSLKEDPISLECLGEVTGDIRMVSSILDNLAKSSVPQQFAGGMMLLYLELVVGVDIGK
jgi:hypothetical protein